MPLMCGEVIITPDLYKIYDRKTVTQEFLLGELKQAKMGLKESKLRDKKVEQLSKKTGFDHDEIYKWHAGFMKDSPTGEMQLSEFTAIYRELFPNGDATKFSTYIFNVIDQDGSGSISFDEFLMVTFVSFYSFNSYSGPFCNFTGYFNRRKAGVGFCFV